MLHTRVLTAAILLVVLVGVARWAPALVFDALLLLIISIACVEWMRLLAASHVTSIAAGVILFGLGLISLLYVPSIMAAAQSVGEGVLAIYVFATLIWLIAVPLAITKYAGIGGQRFAGKIVAFALCFATWLALIQADGFGKSFLLSVLLIVWVADTAAYFAGRAFGKRKLAPRVSPGKTWEGVIGAVAANLILALLLVNLMPVSPTNPAGSIFSLIHMSMGWAFLLAFTVLITLISVMGDLYESLLKRIAGVKDSGRLLPGHGGVFDRIDALVAVFPVTMCVVTLIQLGSI
jgi:phosphatidate cytidylyltransferase